MEKISDIVDFMSSNKKVIIYGAGIVSKLVLTKLLSYGYRNSINTIAVTKKEENPSSVFGISVMAIDELVDLAEKSIVLIATMEYLHKSIGEYLNNLGFQNVYFISDDLYNKWKEDNYLKRYVNPYINTMREICNERNVTCEKQDHYIGETLKILGKHNIVNFSRLVVVLGTKCSLRCKECNNLMPYFKPQCDLDMDAILHSLECILKKIYTVLKCELIGGEPFLCSNLKNTIRFLINQDNVCQIEITTNGTIIPEDSLVPYLQNYKVKIRISDYGELVDKERIVRFLQKHGINYETLKLGYWISPGGIDKRGREIETLEQYYEKCPSGYYCKTLCNGKLFACARAASLYMLGYMKEPEYIEIEKCTTDDLKRFLLKRYSLACDYCDLMCENRKIVRPAEQLKY